MLMFHKISMTKSWTLKFLFFRLYKRQISTLLFNVMSTGTDERGTFVTPLDWSHEFVILLCLKKKPNNKSCQIMKRLDTSPCIRYIFAFCISYKCWLHERVTREIVTPRKPMSTKAKPNKYWLHERGDNFPCYPLVQSI